MGLFKSMAKGFGSMATLGLGGAGGALKPPKAPNPYDLANADTQAQMQAARTNANLNRVDTYTPFGQQTFTNLGGDRWRTDVSLDPAEQQALDLRRRISAGLVSQAEDTLGSRYSLDSVPDMPGTGDFSSDRDALTNAVYSRYTRFLDPQMQRGEDALRNRLANQGIQEGSEAYKNSMFDFNANKDLAYGDILDRAVQAGSNEQSRLFGLGLTARQQGISDYNQERYAPLNEIALLNKSVDVNVPGTISPAQVGVQAPPIGQYMMDKYNVKAGNYNNLMSGLFKLGGAAIMA